MAPFAFTAHRGRLLCCAIRRRRSGSGVAPLSREPRRLLNAEFHGIMTHAAFQRRFAMALPALYLAPIGVRIA